MNNTELTHSKTITEPDYFKGITKQPNLLALKVSIPMWTDAEIQLEMIELKAYIQDLERESKNASYYKDKLHILQNALHIRGSGIDQAKHSWIEED